MTDIKRILADIENLKHISEPCEAGTTRIGFTDIYRKGANYFKQRMKEAGLNVREDEIGNVYGRLEGSQKELPAILSGSHLDTVRCAGAYDGIAGAVCALEAARMIKEQGIKLRHPFEVIGTIEEEGTRFGQVLLGSQYITGVFGEKELDTIHDDTGLSLRKAKESYVLKDACPAYRTDNEILAFLELHDEQGPILEKEKIDIGIVENIVAVSWLTVTVTGFAGHAGTVPMLYRKDAATGGFQLATQITNYVTQNYVNSATATIGRIELFPGSTNCIPDKCIFTIDLRSIKLSHIEEITNFIQREAKAAAHNCNVNIEVKINSNKRPIKMNQDLCHVIEKSCEQLGYSYKAMNSGAGHDAMILSSRWPTAMMFIPCRKGITHNPAEYVSPEALSKGTEVLYQAIIALDNEK